MPRHGTLDLLIRRADKFISRFFALKIGVRTSGQSAADLLHIHGQHLLLNTHLLIKLDHKCQTIQGHRLARLLLNDRIRVNGPMVECQYAGVKIIDDLRFGRHR
ncbi:hypothetical protein D3C81_636670 [compost metagenome]